MAAGSPSQPRVYFSFAVAAGILYVFAGNSDSQAIRSSIVSLIPASPLSDLYEVTFLLPSMFQATLRYLCRLATLRYLCRLKAADATVTRSIINACFYLKFWVQKISICFPSLDFFFLCEFGNWSEHWNRCWCPYSFHYNTSAMEYQNHHNDRASDLGLRYLVALNQNPLASCIVTRLCFLWECVQKLVKACFGDSHLLEKIRLWAAV